ncbi:tetratricopeptide repeat protein 1-like [Neltuma alba]|uniref:tetratricopeptide repeat protein 1-like n=1 Tax=Neltuma alba TaxID=207710 RepID=UPI0010A3E15B|nr:tetratricopeptide repeat protein 1-like [Prosopis alba]XP_028805540.1 tetratricopeptide repeat protein 1-like [Prosopis alba]
MEALPGSSLTSPSPFTTTPFAPSKRQRRRRRRNLPFSVEAEQQEIRVCTNRTCRKQGSFQTLETLSGLAPPNVAVKPCGCLGKCGAGPNLAVLPDGLIVGHCGTAARAAEVMMGVVSMEEGSDSYDAKKSLDALALRKRAEIEFEKQNFTEAELLLSQAIELKPFGGIHVIYKCRSAVRLALSNYSGALDDAREALELAPEYAEAYLCQGDALLELKQFDTAEKSYLASIDIDPSIRRSKSFKARIAKLEEKVAAANKL